MDPKPRSGMLLAPAASSGAAALRMPGQSSFPPLDEHLVGPETRDEIVRGRRVTAQPALPPHGDTHCELDYVVRAHVRLGYISSTDLLTRTGAESDFATDTCVRKAGVNRETGQRWLEELAFEVVYTQSTKDITERAEDLTARGVRRLFAVFVKERAVKEWSPGARAFHALAPGSAIEDPCLNRPIPVAALLSAAEADNAVARALVAKRNPVIVAEKADSKAEGRVEGKAEGKAEDILTVLAMRGVAVTDADQRRILASTDLAQLKRWLVKALDARDITDVLAEP